MIVISCHLDRSGKSITLASRYERCALECLYEIAAQGNHPMSSIDSALGNVVAAKQAAVETQIGVAVAAKSLDAARLQGDAAVELLDAAAQLSKALGRGQQFDGQA